MSVQTHIKNKIAAAMNVKNLGFAFAAACATIANASPATLAEKLEKLSAQAAAWEAQKDADLTVLVPKLALKKGSKGKDAKILCEALEIRGFGACEARVEVDTALAARIEAAQEFYGLQVDGIADSQLYFALETSATKKARLARAAVLELAELGKSAPSGGGKWVSVNAATFMLSAYEGQELSMESKVIVGRPDRQTPFASMNILSLKFNPNWTPPPGIMAKDVYPSLDQGGGWIKKHGLVMRDKDGNTIDPEGVSSQEAKENGYHFTQPAGDWAALGKLKFETDSKDAVYLHDTNERYLFKQAMRAKSSGCMRVQSWEALAAWVAGSSEQSIKASVATGRTQWQKVDRIPVSIGYRQADVVGGKVVVYPDVYGLRK